MSESDVFSRSNDMTSNATSPDAQENEQAQGNGQFQRSGQLQENGQAKGSEQPYLSNLYLESFGRFHDRNIGPFEPGLNVVYGQNEAGKTTAMAFVRQMLYGWTSNRSSENTYDTASGNRSGSLFFTDGIGQWELRRGKKKGDVSVVRHEGHPWDSAFDDICSNVAEDTYRTVFSFSAEELMALPSDSGSMTAKLFTAGSGTHVAPTQVRGELRDAGKLISGRRSEQLEALGTLRESIATLRDEIAELTEKARGYSDERIELEQLEHEQDERAAKLVELKRHISQLETDRTRAETAYEHIRKLSGEKQTADSSLKHKRQDEQDKQLAEDEKLLLERAVNVDKAYRESANLKSGYDRMVEYERDLKRAQDQLAERENPGCTTGPAFRRELISRKERGTELASEVKHCKDALKQTQLKVSSLDAIEGAQPEVLRTPPRKGLMICGIIGAALGCCALAYAIIAFLMSLAAMSSVLIAGGAGIILLVLGVVLLTAGRSKVNHTEMDDRKNKQQAAQQKAAEELAYADTSLSQAMHEQEEFSKECAEFFDENGLDPELKDFDLALDLLVEQGEYNREMVEVDKLEKRYLMGRRDFTSLYSLVQRTLMPVSPDVDKIKPGEIVEHIADLHARLVQAQERGQAYDAAYNQAQRSAEQASQVGDSLALEEGSIADIAQRNGLSGDQDIMSELTSLLAEAQRESASLEQAQNESSARHGNLTSVLDAGAKETDLQHKRMEYEELKARQARSAQRYAELLCAQELMTHSIEAWEQEKQPEVYRLATELFRDMTGGRWTKIVSEGDGIFVFDASRRRFPTDKLSTGTTQQLYLSLRIALLLTAREAGRVLPVIADDILVSFDSSRREGAARAIKRLASQRQVIVFTCHRKTQELLGGPDTNAFDI